MSSGVFTRCSGRKTGAEACVVGVRYTLRGYCPWHGYPSLGNYLFALFALLVPKRSRLTIITATEGLSKMKRNHIHLAQGRDAVSGE